MTNHTPSFSDKVFEIVRKIPKGKVATYGQIADLCGSHGASRAVGNTLHKNPEFGFIPCHRVLNSQGFLAEAFVFGGKEVQKQLLEEEGVEVSSDFRVDLQKYLW